MNIIAGVIADTIRDRVGAKNMAPPWGLPTQRAPQELFQKELNLIAKQAFRVRICTMSCMREATYISNGFRMRAGPLGP